MKKLFIPLIFIIQLYSLEIPELPQRSAIPVRQLNNIERSAVDQSPSPEPGAMNKCNCNSKCSTDTKIIIASITGITTILTTVSMILIHYYG